MSETKVGLALPRDTPGSPGEAIRVFFRHGSPRLLVAALALVAVVRLKLDDWALVDVALVLVVLGCWPALEWFIHVHLLHFQPRTVLGLRLHPLSARRHREHHLDPWRFERAFIPVPTLCASVTGLTLSAALLPPSAWTAAFTVLALGLHYEWVHYLCHIRMQPRSRRYRVLIQNHRRHHFKSEHHWMGVSMLGGDVLFGTGGEPDLVDRSPSVRTLDDDRAA